MVRESGAGRAAVAGACISGQVRTFFAPCVGPQMRDNLLIPLRLRTHVALHGKNVSAGAVTATLSGVDLGSVDVRPPLSLRGARCPEMANAWRQSVGLFTCYLAIERDNVPYSWVVRLRSDHMVPFRMTSLPCAACYYASHRWATGIAIVGNLAGCTCGWERAPCDHPDRPTHCDRLDDQFALLHGGAVGAYLRDTHLKFCEMAEQGRPINPEQRTARLLRNVTAHDIRFISLAMHPRLQRTSDCTEPRDNRIPRATPVTIDVPARATREPLPDGPWDQRRSETCQYQRSLPAERRYRCLQYNGQWDDALYGQDATRQLALLRRQHHPYSRSARLQVAPASAGRRYDASRVARFNRTGGTRLLAQRLPVLPAAYSYYSTRSMRTRRP